MPPVAVSARGACRCCRSQPRAGFPTLVAATAVLGSQLSVYHVLPRVVSWFLGLAAAMWLLITYTFLAAMAIGQRKPGLHTGLNGTWLLLIVATGSIAVLATEVSRMDGDSTSCNSTASAESPRLQNLRTLSSPPLYPAMAHIFFAASIQRHIATPEREIDARTLGEALEAVFVAQPRLRGYILDDQGSLRPHLAVFVDGRRVHDREHLSDALGEQSRVYVVQALSGG
ncbi:sulfur carrier protein ThiS [Paraburkholderia youngii]